VDEFRTIATNGINTENAMTKVNEIRYETPMEKVNFILPTVFLAGPTVRGNQQHLISWRFEAINIFKDKNFEGNLIIPEFIDKTESDKHRDDIPIWEYNGLSKCHVIMFWIPRTRELIGLTTNHELGYWMGRDRTKIVYGRPDDAYRIKYLDIMWKEDAKRYKNCNNFIFNNMEEIVNEALKLKYYLPKNY